jgi:Pretoxin HINT domain
MMMRKGWALLALWMALLAGGPARADVSYKICPDPGVCFADKAAKDAWAAKNGCRFLEDVCEKTPTKDDKGAPEADRGFWGSLWDSVKGGLVYGYEFVKGLVAGLKDQAEGIIALITGFGDVVDGLVHLGKSFYDDPKGTAIKLAEVIGQEVVDNITRAIACGPYDLGKVIGQNVSPVLVAKLATKIARYGGDLSKAAKATRLELGCASFVAGTMVLTPSGPVPIERLAEGQAVLSRSDKGFADAPQSIVKTFGRRAEAYHRLTTEHDTIGVTEEHPLWLQGKGWTVVKEVVRGDVLVTAAGDVTVLDNERVDVPTRVYNFSVDKTPSYFVGEGVWAHNASPSCDIKALASLKPKERGYRGELYTAVELEGKGYSRVGNTFDPAKYPDTDAAFKAWDGQTGIDGIFKNSKGEYVIVESKTTGGVKKADPAGCVDKLCNTADGRQMSMDWIDARLDAIVTDPAERARIRAGLASGTVKRVYAQTDSSGTTYNEIVTRAGDPSQAEIGAVWKP